MQAYKKLYSEAQQDPEGFWLEQASRLRTGLPHPKPQPMFAKTAWLTGFRTAKLMSVI